MSYRSRIRGLCGDLKTSLHLLSDLRGRVEAKNTALEREMQEIQEILTPNQSAKFILWVSDNPACMQMLEQLWSSMHANSEGAASSALGGGGSNSSSPTTTVGVDKTVERSNESSSPKQETSLKRKREDAGKAAAGTSEGENGSNKKVSREK